MYLIVEFKEHKETAPIAKNWMDDGQAWWPPFTDRTRLLKSVRKMEPPHPDKGWVRHRVRVLFETDSFDNIVEKWKRSCETSNLNLDAEPSKRQSKKNPRYSSSEEMSDTAPPPPKTKIKKAARAQPPAPTPPPPPPLLREKTQRAMAQLGAGQDRPNEADHNPPPMPCDDLAAVISSAMAPWNSWTDEAAHDLLPMPSSESSTWQGMNFHPIAPTPQSSSDSRRISSGRLVPAQCTAVERTILEAIGGIELQLQHLTSMVLSLMDRRPPPSPPMDEGEENFFPQQQQ
ncbi:uncharacterized protein LOC144525016 [Sander vitreus]